MRATFLIVALLAFVLSACSTAGSFVLPAQTTLRINGHETEAVKRHPGMLSTRAFGWGASGGVPYELTDGQGNVVRTGKLRTHFRMGSLFFPPGAVFVVPQGLRRDMVYDLTKPADGKAVLP